MAFNLEKYLVDLRTLPEDLGRSWRTDGFAGIATVVRQRSLDRVALRARSLVIECDLETVPEVIPPQGIVIREFTGDWAELGDLVGLRLAPTLSAARAAGRRCMVAWRGSRAVGLAWVAPSMDVRYDRFTLPLPPDAVYLWAVQVTLDQRNRNVGRALASTALRWAAGVGWRRGWMIIKPGNRASLRATAGLVPGGRVLGSVTRTKLLARMTSHYEPLPAPVAIGSALPA